MIENSIVFLVVISAAVYTVVRLRRVAGGESKCVCGSNSCGSSSRSCNTGSCGIASDVGNASGLPVISPPCNHGDCGKG